MLPEKFIERMKKLLGDEYAEFEKALSESTVKGIRVNTTKISVDDFLSKTKLKLTPIPYADYGFIPENTEGIGTTPEHHAGMFYVQDPGAMATVTALEIKRGYRVLDACSAPGGKASQLASLIGDEGFILANEYVPKRAKIIVGNFERLGIKNAVVTSLDTKVLPKLFDSYFDLVLCDAPCSGEGMFRKYDEALSEWSEENVALCKSRQGEILHNLSTLVKDGGYLLYSTCTYSPEENEETVSEFLSSHDDYTLVDVSGALKESTSDGLPPFEMTRRFYPHKSAGEGQYVALMKRAAKDDCLPTILYKENTKPLTKDELRTVEKFLSDTLSVKISPRFIKLGDEVVMILHDTPLPPVSVFMSGVMLGEIKKGILFPHHQFFSAFGGDMKLSENLTSDDPRTARYLRGEEIETESGASGWCAVLYEGIPLGGGKMSSGRIKNHYPKGLRNK